MPSTRCMLTRTCRVMLYYSGQYGKPLEVTLTKSKFSLTINLPVENANYGKRNSISINHPTDGKQRQIGRPDSSTTTISPLSVRIT